MKKTYEELEKQRTFISLNIRREEFEGFTTMSDTKTIKLHTLLRGPGVVRAKPKSSHEPVTGLETEKAENLSKRKRRQGFLSLGKPTPSGVRKLVDKL